MIYGFAIFICLFIFGFAIFICLNLIILTQLLSVPDVLCLAFKHGVPREMLFLI